MFNQSPIDEMIAWLEKTSQAKRALGVKPAFNISLPPTLALAAFPMTKGSPVQPKWQLGPTPLELFPN